MNVFDIVIASFLILGFVSGFIKGLFSEVASLVAVIAGIYVAVHFSYFTENFLKENFLDWSEQTNKTVAYIVTFLGVVLLIILIGKILTKIADIVAMGLINKIFGGVFSTLKIALVFSLLLAFLDFQKIKIPFLSDEIIETSIFYQPIKTIVPTFFPLIKEEISI